MAAYELRISDWSSDVCSSDLDQLCFVGTGLKQPIMIVTLSADGASKSRADVEAGLIAEMNAVNATLENHEQIGKIIVAKEAWTIDNKYMKPNTKVTRKESERTYGTRHEKNADHNTEQREME